ncbi:MAG: ribose 5-phosphate isomerase B [Pirellulaceae bacterium]|nr:ribose 5-phosphate isomerase B [Planctomycetales bacterium]
MRIAIGNDHRGVQFKRKLVDLLSRLGHEVVDVGTDSSESVDYPDIASLVACKVAKKEVDRGILICGTGIGMAITANKVPGIRATTCHDEVTAEICRRHNDVNVLCLSADLVGEQRVQRMVEVWLGTEFDGGRHERRISKIAELESQACHEPCEGGGCGG